MSIRRIVSGLVAATFLVVPASNVLAQSRSSGVASLGEMGCQKIGGGRYKTVNEDIAIGREIFRSVALLGTPGSLFATPGIYRDEPAQVACRLAPVNAAPQFRTLTLSFGLREDSRYLDGSVIVRLSVYKDGNFYGDQTISKGDKIRWPIDIMNTRSLSLEAECVRPGQNYDYCPNIWFVEDILSR